MHTILVATTRERDSRPGTLFNGERADSLDFAQLAVSVPPSHVPSKIEWASTAPGNAANDFVVQKANYIDSDRQFLQQLNAQLANKPRGQRKVLLFIHGYNTMFAEAVYRVAQIAQDSNSPAVPVLFTWASRGKLVDYVYDNNSATIARDDLERTLRLLFASDADQINVLAHSMGNWTTVEAFRQIKIAGRPPGMDKLGFVFLASPDIDVDVFKSQLRRFGKPKKPFYIVLSKDDKALRVSKFIAGDKNRLGADSNTAELAALGAVVIDLSDLKATDSTNHDKFTQLAEVAPQLAQVLSAGVESAPASRAAGSLSALPLTILGAPVTILAGH